MNISMTTQPISLDGRTWARFVRMVKNFAASEVGGKARWRFTLLIALLFAINGLNVVNSYVGRDFMTAIENATCPAFSGWPSSTSACSPLPRRWRSSTGLARKRSV